MVLFSGLPKLPAFPGLSKKTKEMKHTLKNGSTTTSSTALSNQPLSNNSNINSQSMSNIPESKSLFEKRTSSSKGRISSMHIHIGGGEGIIYIIIIENYYRIIVINNYVCLILHFIPGESPSLSSQTLEQTSNSTSGLSTNGSLTLSNLSLGTSLKQDSKSNESKLFSLAEFRKNKDLDSIRIPLRDYSREEDNGVFDCSSIDSEGRDGSVKTSENSDGKTKGFVGTGSNKMQQISQV